tara:strand:+ start:2074 stop:2202 length:129 start_codon:yes stop_codon:yes gene_type:complete
VNRREKKQAKLVKKDRENEAVRRWNAENLDAYYRYFDRLEND